MPLIGLHRHIRP